MSVEATAKSESTGTVANAEQVHAEKRVPGAVSRIFMGLLKWLWFIVVIGFFLGIALAIGSFSRFTYTAALLETAPLEVQADGLVVLTGGEERIKTAITLLEQNEGIRLLITGVDMKTTLNDIAKVNGVSADELPCCVDIDHTALDTMGNASAAAEWASENDYQSLVVVTSNIHMARSLLEFRRAMPDVVLVAHPVQVYDLISLNWLQTPEVWRSLFTEYGKFALAHLRSIVSDGMIRWASRTAKSFTA